MSATLDGPERRGSKLVLEPQQIVRTVEALRDRISERFPGSGLGRLADDMVLVARAAVERLHWVAAPHWPLRIGVGLLIAVIAIMLASLFVPAAQPAATLELNDPTKLIQLLESIMNDLFLIGASIFFLFTFEGRIKRRRALKFLRELRALAHIVDMHQLTKDPDRLFGEGGDTPSSPVRRMTRFELGRYLDYCTEMLSLISKVAALYVQDFDDPVVLAAVDEVEALTSGLSGKIYQKIMILERSSANI
ncbi:MAG TPA: hypothetical protein VK864_05960 [Longimicrobiales bacterium]|nr:hypothetical protein [Longimicrobiales bacterium]